MLGLVGVLVIRIGLQVNDYHRGGNRKFGAFTYATASHWRGFVGQCSFFRYYFKCLAEVDSGQRTIFISRVIEGRLGVFTMVSQSAHGGLSETFSSVV